MTPRAAPEAPPSTPAPATYDGEGECYKVFSATAADAATGERPAAFHVERRGQREGVTRIALTFDDGPDPRFTGPLLDVLKREGVPAAFFIMGERAALHPELVKRAVAEGHILGNHTYAHPHLETLSREDLRAQIDDTARVIESASGVRTRLFRSPYDTDSTPTHPVQLTHLAEVTAMGYECVGANVSAEDYLDGVTPESIAHDILAQIGEHGAYVVCLHDAGGDRSATVGAIPLIIREARARGWSLVGLDDLLETSVAALNPPVTTLVASHSDPLAPASTPRTTPIVTSAPNLGRPPAAPSHR